MSKLKKSPIFKYDNFYVIFIIIVYYGFIIMSIFLNIYFDFCGTNSVLTNLEIQRE